MHDVGGSSGTHQNWSDKGLKEKHLGTYESSIATGVAITSLAHQEK